MTSLPAGGLPPESPFDLSGKVALVTGAGQGLGAAIAQRFAEHGATVVVSDLDRDRMQATVAQITDSLSDQSSAARSESIVDGAICDVSDPGQVETTVAAIVERFGRIDVLVNNAGIHRRVDATDWSQADLDALLSVNLLGMFYTAGAVGRAMVEQGSGSIINMSALGGGVVGLGRAGSMYGMTKGAIVSLTRDLAAEWGPRGVRVNALAPGWIRTPMTAALQHDPERSGRVMKRVPLGRWGEADDVAGAALFLASDASAYVTGHTIPIDGGAANVITLD